MCFCPCGAQAQSSCAVFTGINSSGSPGQPHIPTVILLAAGYSVDSLVHSLRWPAGINPHVQDFNSAFNVLPNAVCPTWYEDAAANEAVHRVSELLRQQLPSWTWVRMKAFRVLFGWFGSVRG